MTVNTLPVSANARNSKMCLLFTPAMNSALARQMQSSVVTRWIPLPYKEKKLKSTTNTGSPNSKDYHH